MKRIFDLPWMLLLAVATWALPTAAQVRVVTTTTDLGDLARTVGGERVQVDTICHGEQDPHHVQAKPSYMVTLSRADLLLSVGLELEVGWLPSLIQGARNPDINPGHPGFLEAARFIDPIDVPRGPVDRSAGDIHPRGNPHYWLDPDNAKRVARGIAGRLSELDPPGAGTFQKNVAAFEGRIDRAIARWTATLASLKGTKLATYHAAFNYFLRRFGLVSVANLEDRPGIPPSPAHLADVIREMRANGVRVILHERYYDEAVSKLVASRAGARVLVLATSVGGAAGVGNYEQLIDQVVHAVAQSVRGGR